MDSISNLINSETKCKVSTVLNNNNTEFGKHHMFDGLSDSSWYSDQAKFQYVFLFFEKPVNVKLIELTCSGGFCPKVLIYLFYEVEVSYCLNNEFNNKKPVMTMGNTFYLDDTNEKQKMSIEIEKCQSLKFSMKSFYDLYGRVIVYDLKVYGMMS
jgi:hypothetical protein